MGLRFRKSVKIAPGLKLNFNKKSVGMTFGGKGVNYTLNSKGKRTASVGIPGTGLYYTHTSSSNTSSSNQSSSNNVVSSGKNPNNGGCIITLLKMLGILILIPFAIAFGWIAGIVWILFFRKRLNDNPEKQKKMTVWISIASVVSLIITIYSLATAPPALESLKISSDMEGQELEVNSDYEIKITHYPKDSVLENLEYHVDGNATLKKSNSLSVATLHTSSEGTVTIYVSSGTIRSNSISFKIVDSTKDISNTDESDSKSEFSNEENNPETETPSTSNTDSSEVDDTTTTNDNPPQPANSAATATAPIVDNSEVNNQSTVEDIPESNTPPVTNSNSHMVWIDDTGKKYHASSTCSNMSAPYQVTVDEAIASGRDACKKCY